MGITEQGIAGEQMLFKVLDNRGWEFFQPDAIGEKNGKFYVFEAKHQARYKAPPFDGHGLPRWQINRRLDFENRTGIGTILVVFDSETDEVFFSSLRALENGNHFDTNGGKPRRIYELSSFKKA